MNKIYIVDLEPIESRYTVEWKVYVPKYIQAAIEKSNAPYTVEVIEGTDNIPNAVTPGAFINFGGTNMYKSSQLMKIAEMFTLGKVSAGDKFLYTDAWNPTIIQVKYMSELLQIPVEIHALWHAGSYDSADFLGRLITDKSWITPFEQSLFNAIDVNYFATEFHKDMFPIKNGSRTKIAGWPMEYLQESIFESNKEDIILFPHRLAPEKQLHIFKELQRRMPQYTWIVCQEQNLTKQQYHELLSKSKIVLSTSLQETLGIAMYEAALAGSIPLVPDRLSYTEMYTDDFKYPSDYTIDQLELLITDTMQNYDALKQKLPVLLNRLNPYFTSTELINKLLN